MKIKTTIDVTYFNGEQVKTGKLYASVMEAGYAMNFNHLSFAYRLFEENDSFISQSNITLIGEEIDLSAAQLDSTNYMIPQEFTERQKIEYRFAIILKLKLAQQFSLSLNDIEIVLS